MADQDISVTASVTDDHVVVKLTPPSAPSGDSTVPTNICIVMDASGSMNAQADMSGEGSDGLTVLDMCKHACKTVVKMLSSDDQDNFGLVTFSDDSRVDIPLSSAAGKDQLIEQIEGLSTRGRTNIWAGMQEGIMMLEPKRGQNNHLLLLTDGLPNVGPDEGEAEALKKMIETNSDGLPCAVHMCGFGYNLASPMLTSVSHLGGGSYSFVPDCSVLGSVFVNWTANVQTTIMSKVMVTVSSESGFAPSKLKSEVLKSCVRDPTSDERRVELASVSYDQARYVALEIPTGSVAVGAEVDVKVDFVHWQNGRDSKIHTVKVTKGDAETAVAPLRTAAADICLYIAEEAGREPQPGVMPTCEFRPVDVEELKVVTGTAKSLGVEQHELGEGLLKDLEGQMSEATSRQDWFKKWGRHYLPSLALAHWAQRSNNFKDGVQVYGSDLFNDIVDAGGEIFKSLELKASRRGYSSYGSSAPAASAASYYDPSGVCVAPDTPVLLADGTTAKASVLVKGASVRCSDGSTATVECVVRSPAPKSGLVAVKGVRMTPWHPVVDQGQWVPAIEAAGAVEDGLPSSGEVFNFVLSNGHNVVLVGENGARVVAATLGHNMTDTSAVAHTFFGTRAVIDALAACDGWESGDVKLRGVRRDCHTTQIVGVVC